MHNFSNKLQLISYDKTNILVNYAPLCSTIENEKIFYNICV